ncbi:DNA alkylation repair protein [Aureispira sp. CCB-QB1]|uniref:DNA alkylation repair protein n=1 Tax=Aureispira sp. CCB-QB1 TaxID=1313421 RepID=UPI0006973043|nr:DNA alkylation repair protein [Aureispira sp. CCB-QB1]
MTLKEVLTELEALGDERTKNTLLKHGAKEPFFGVKVGDLKKILKKTKKNHELSLELYATGNSDAMYLAGLMADEKQITVAHLEDWVEKAYWYYLSEYTVAWVAAETDFGFEIAQKWIASEKETVASAGWSTLSNVASIKKDEELDIEAYSQLLDQVVNEINTAPNRVRYTMNGFVIAVGSYIAPLTTKAQEVAQKIGKVSVEMGGTACKVPLASTYIQKVIDKNRLGKKRKQARC